MTDPSALQSKIATLSTVDAAQRAREARARLARDDFGEFVRFVMRDEKSNVPLEPAWVHEEWERLSQAHRRLILMSSVELGKSQQRAVAKTLWRLGRDPTQRIVVLSNTHGQAVLVTQQIAKYIQTSPELRLVFPDLRRGVKWTQSEIFLERATTAKDPSLRAMYVNGPLTGGRVDGLLVDDILDWEITRTKDARDQLESWFWSTPMNRLDKHAWVEIIGNAWHPDDLLHRLARLPEWCTRVFPVYATPEFRRHYPMVPEGQLLWPERWDAERVAHEKREKPPAEFARAYLCRVRADEDARFKQEWIDAALRRGHGQHPYRSTREWMETIERSAGVDAETARMAMQVLQALEDDAEEPQHVRIFTGVDVSTGESTDLSALVTFAVGMDGTRHLLEVDAGRWQIDELEKRVVSAHRRFGSIMVVESVATQRWLVQILRKRTAIPVVPFNTDRRKHDPRFGFETLALELANGKWVFPGSGGEGGRTHPQVQALCDELLFYNPKAHTGDRAMALWFANHAARRYEADVERPGVSIKVF